jgi:tetratricopeptide (TPR) repeat protein
MLFVTLSLHSDPSRGEEKLETLQLSLLTSLYSPYQQAKQCLAARQYDNIVSLCSEEIANEASPYLAEAMLLRATFYLLLGQGEEASKDLERVLDMNDLNRMVRVQFIHKLFSGLELA